MLIAGAYAVVGYYLVTFDNYPLLLDTLWRFDIHCRLLLAAVVALMPLNLLLEALKWRSMIWHIQHISVARAMQATLIGQVGAVVSPNRIADYPTRCIAIEPHNRLSATILGYISSWTLTIVIGTAGIIAASCYLTHYPPQLFDSQYLITSATIVIIIIVILFVTIPIIGKTTHYSHRIRSLWHTTWHMVSTTPLQNITVATLFSLLRYTLFSTQYYLTLTAFGVNLSPAEALMTIPTIYLLTTITPTVTLSEAAVRTSYAIAVLAPISSLAPLITLATTTLWCINNGIPIVAGTYLFKLKTKPN